MGTSEIAEWFTGLTDDQRHAWLATREITTEMVGTLPAAHRPTRAGEWVYQTLSQVSSDMGTARVSCRAGGELKAFLDAEVARRR